VKLVVIGNRRDIETAIRNALLMFSDGTVIENPRFQYKIDRGQGFSASRRFTNVSSDGSVSMLLENPSGSTATIYLILAEVATFASAWIDVYRGVEWSGGDAVPIMNLDLGSGAQSVARAVANPTWSGGEKAHETVCPGGTTRRAIGSAVEIGETVKIPPGNSILVVVTNKSSASQDLSIRFLWWEDPLT